MMTPWDRKRLARSLETYYKRTHNPPRFYAPDGEQCTVHEFVEQVRPVPLALRFDVALSEADKIRLHGMGVEVR